MSSSDCCFLTCIQVSQEAGQVVWYSHTFQNFPQWILLIWSLVPLPFLNPVCTSESSWLIYCWSLAWRILSMPLQHVKWVQLCSSLNSLWHFPSLVLEWKLTFSPIVVQISHHHFLKRLFFQNCVSCLFCYRLIDHRCIYLRASQVTLVGKNLPANAEVKRDVGSIPRMGRYPRRGHGNPLQFSCLENPMELGGLQPMGLVAKSCMWLSDYNTFTLCLHTNFEIFFSSSVKNAIGNLIGIALYL